MLTLLNESSSSEECLGRYLAAFENHTLPKAEFTHSGHVTVAACYLFGSDSAAALPAMRSAIRGFNESVGGQNTDSAGYHESLTVLWLRLVERHLQSAQPETRLSAVRSAVAEFGSKSWLHREFYSCLLYTSPSPRDGLLSRMPSSA